MIKVIKTFSSSGVLAKKDDLISIGEGYGQVSHIHAEQLINAGFAIEYNGKVNDSKPMEQKVDGPLELKKPRQTRKPRETKKRV